MRNWFYLANSPIMMFVGGKGGGRLQPEIILYTSHFLFGVTCVSKLYLWRAPLKFNRRKSSLDVGLAGAVWVIPFFIRNRYSEEVVNYFDS